MTNSLEFLPCRRHRPLRRIAAPSPSDGSLPTRRARLALLIAALTVPASAFAIGLGDFRLLSSLGQPLAAQIELINAGTDDSAHCYNLKPGSDAETGYPWLRHGTLTIERANGRSHLILRSTEPVWEPVIEVGIEIGCGGSLSRRYTVLPDLPQPPLVKIAAAENDAAAAVPAASPRRAAPAAAPRAKGKTPLPSVVRSKAMPHKSPRTGDHLSLGAMEPVSLPAPTIRTVALSRDGDAEMLETIRRQNEALAEANRRLAELTQQLAEFKAATRAAQSTAASATVAAAPSPTTPTPARDTWPNDGILIFGIVGAAGVAAAVLRRATRAKAERLDGDAGDSPRSDEDEAIDTKTHWSAAIAAARPAPSPPTIEPPSASTPFDEEAAVIELSDVLLSLGMNDEASNTLASYAEVNPKKALTPWLRLLLIYRRSGQRDHFEALAKRVVSAYNIDDIPWDGFDLTVGSGTLEHYGHIVERLLGLWHTEAGLDYLRHLLTDNRDGARSGFPIDVINEILLLIAVHNAGVAA